MSAEKENSQKFVPNKLIPLKKGQRCQLRLKNGKLRMTLFDEDKYCSDIVPTFFPATKKVPRTASHIKLSVDLAFLAKHLDGSLCLLMVRQKNGTYALPDVTQKEPPMSLLDMCQSYVDDWISHDWWFKQLAVIEKVPSISEHRVTAVYGQWLNAAHDPKRENFIWVSMNTLLSWKEDMLDPQLRDFVHSPVFESWCRLYSAVYCKE